MGKKRGDSVVLSVRIPVELARRVKAYAAFEGVSMQELVRDLLAAGVPRTQGARRSG